MEKCRSSRYNYSDNVHGTMKDLRDSSAMTRVKERYWATKQKVFRRLGKKDDDCIVASDSELDTKLELFQNIEESFLMLLRVLENFQDILCAFAQEENAMGRFLKENGKHDKTRAGEIMIGAGKALSCNAQQKLSLRVPLIRLYQEVETFQYRAIVDTLQTIDKMEKSRAAYRAALMWMKDVSQELDPDTFKQLEKFRKVQSHVRKSKARFDKLKLDTLQKVDLLSFSRCNLFSQALAGYQNAFITTCKKVFHAMSAVAETTKGYQHYEFSMLKELVETSKKLAEKATEEQSTFTDDRDAVLFFESEYYDEIKNKERDKMNNTEKHVETSNGVVQKKKGRKKAKNMEKKENESNLNPLLEIDSAKCSNSIDALSELIEPKHENAEGEHDLLSGNVQIENMDKGDMLLLKDILDTSIYDSSFSVEQQSLHNLSQANKPESSSSENASNCFLPSYLWDLRMEQKRSQISETLDDKTIQNAENSNDNNRVIPSRENKKGHQDMSAWFNLFADLDPLANPDLVGKKQELEDRNC